MLLEENSDLILCAYFKRSFLVWIAFAGSVKFEHLGVFVIFQIARALPQRITKSLQKLIVLKINF